VTPLHAEAELYELREKNRKAAEHLATTASAATMDITDARKGLVETEETIVLVAHRMTRLSPLLQEHKLVVRRYHCQNELPRFFRTGLTELLQQGNHGLTVGYSSILNLQNHTTIMEHRRACRILQERTMHGFLQNAR